MEQTRALVVATTPEASLVGATRLQSFLLELARLCSHHERGESVQWEGEPYMEAVSLGLVLVMKAMGNRPGSRFDTEADVWEVLAPDLTLSLEDGLSITYPNMRAAAISFVDEVMRSVQRETYRLMRADSKKSLSLLGLFGERAAQWFSVVLQAAKRLLQSSLRLHRRVHMRNLVPVSVENKGFTFVRLADPREGYVLRRGALLEECRALQQAERQIDVLRQIKINDYNSAGYDGRNLESQWVRAQLLCAALSLSEERDGLPSELIRTATLAAARNSAEWLSQKVWERIEKRVKAEVLPDVHILLDPRVKEEIEHIFSLAKVFGVRDELVEHHETSIVLDYDVDQAMEHDQAVEIALRKRSAPFVDGIGLSSNLNQEALEQDRKDYRSVVLPSRIDWNLIGWPVWKEMVHANVIPFKVLLEKVYGAAFLSAPRVTELLSVSSFREHPWITKEGVSWAVRHGLFYLTPRRFIRFRRKLTRARLSAYLPTFIDYVNRLGEEEGGEKRLKDKYYNALVEVLLRLKQSDLEQVVAGRLSRKFFLSCFNTYVFEDDGKGDTPWIRLWHRLPRGLREQFVLVYDVLARQRFFQQRSMRSPWMIPWAAPVGSLWRKMWGEHSQWRTASDIAMMADVWVETGITSHELQRLMHSYSEAALLTWYFESEQFSTVSTERIVSEYEVARNAYYKQAKRSGMPPLPTAD